MAVTYTWTIPTLERHNQMVAFTLLTGAVLVRMTMATQHLAMALVA